MFSDESNKPGNTHVCKNKINAFKKIQISSGPTYLKIFLSVLPSFSDQSDSLESMVNLESWSVETA